MTSSIAAPVCSIRPLSFYLDSEAEGFDPVVHPVSSSSSPKRQCTSRASFCEGRVMTPQPPSPDSSLDSFFPIEDKIVNFTSYSPLESLPKTPEVSFSNDYSPPSPPSLPCATGATDETGLKTDDQVREFLGLLRQNSITVSYKL